MNKEELLELINKIDQSKNIYVEFTVNGPLGQTIRRADNYFTGKAIIEVWEKEIINAELKN